MEKSNTFISKAYSNKFSFDKLFISSKENNDTYVLKSDSFVYENFLHILLNDSQTEKVIT